MQRILEPGGAHEGLVLARGAGWIGEIGISRHRSPVLVEALRASGFAAVQVPLNPVERHAEAGPLPLARSAGVGVIAMKALGAGTLRHPRACLRYVLAQDVTAAVVGVGRLSELEEDASAVLDLRLPTAEEHEELKAERQRVGVYACQRYGACQACPEGIRPLEALFWALGMARKRGVADVGEDVRETVHGLGLSRCSGCGVCESLCPNGLPIRRAIREAAALFGAEPPLGGSSPP